MKTVLALIVLTASVSAEYLSLKGVKIGDTKADVLKTLDLRCRWNDDTFAEQCIKESDLTGRSELVQKMIWDNAGTCSEFGLCSLPLSVGGVSTRFALDFKHDDHLCLMTGNVPTENYSIIRDALIQKYGKPDSQENSIVTTRMGVEFPSEATAWLRNGVELKIEERAVNVDEARVSLVSSLCVEKELEAAKNRANSDL